MKIDVVLMKISSAHSTYQAAATHHLRKLMLTGFVLLIPEDHQLGRTLAALLVSLLFLAAQATLSCLPNSNRGAAFT